MANWLEDEERKHLVKQQTDLLQSQRRIQREQDTLRAIRRFHDICKRVNAIRNSPLEIDHLRVKGPVHTFNTEFKFGERLLGKRFSINLSLDQQTTIIEAVQTELYDDGLGCEDGRESRGSRDIVLRQHTCSLQDLSDWTEENILNVIRWLSHAIVDISSSLPGIEIMNVEGRLIVSLFKKHSFNVPEPIEVYVDGKLMGRVESSDITNDGQIGRAFNIYTGEHVLTVTRGYRKTSIPLHLKAGRVIKYEVSSSFFGISLSAC